MIWAQYSLEEKNKAIKNVTMIEKYLKLNNVWKFKKKDCLIYENNNF